MPWPLAPRINFNVLAFEPFLQSIDIVGPENYSYNKKSSYIFDSYSAATMCHFTVSNIVTTTSHMEVMESCKWEEVGIVDERNLRLFVILTLEERCIFLYVRDHPSLGKGFQVPSTLVSHKIKP